MTARGIRCHRCGGPYCDDYDGEFSCLMCGEIKYTEAPTIKPLKVAPPADADRPQEPKRKRSKQRTARPSQSRVTMDLLRRAGVVA